MMMRLFSTVFGDVLMTKTMIAVAAFYRLWVMVIVHPAVITQP
jgi:hypothetical protein